MQCTINNLQLYRSHVFRSFLSLCRYTYTSSGQQIVAAKHLNARTITATPCNSTTIRVHDGNAHFVRIASFFAFFLFALFTKFKIYVTFEPHEIYTLIDNETAAAVAASAKISSYLNSLPLLFLFPPSTQLELAGR